MAKLENWSIVHGSANPYQPPELWIPRLHGIISGHPRIEDGKTVTTSRIVKEENGVIITKSGTKYELGDIDPVYEKLFPNAKERLITSLKK